MPLSRRDLLRRAAPLPLLPVLPALSALHGCARQPPSRNALSGRRMRVTLSYAAEVNPLFYYYFLIRYDTSQGVAGDAVGQTGPVPVLGPTSAVGSWGNGFATGPGGTAGFTDFVLFNIAEPQGYSLYHVNGDPNDRTRFINPVRPIAFTPPAANPDDLNSRLLRFEIDLSQIIYDASGQPPADVAEAANRAREIRYLQVNAVSTNIIPVGTASVTKLVDAFGDTAGLLEASNYVTIDVTQFGRNYTQADFPSAEEPDRDVFGGYDPRLDLVSWSIQPLNQSR